MGRRTHSRRLWGSRSVLTRHSRRSTGPTGTTHFLSPSAVSAVSAVPAVSALFLASVLSLVQRRVQVPTHCLTNPDDRHASSPRDAAHTPAQLASQQAPQMPVEPCPPRAEPLTPPATHASSTLAVCSRPRYLPRPWPWPLCTTMTTSKTSSPSVAGLHTLPRATHPNLRRFSPGSPRQSASTWLQGTAPSACCSAPLLHTTSATASTSSTRRLGSDGNRCALPCLAFG